MFEDETVCCINSSMIARNGRSMQTNFLTNRFKQYREAMKTGLAVMDRSIYSDRIFAACIWNTGI
jgi:deoxyadenosine/deoxycytidine kinase